MGKTNQNKKVVKTQEEIKEDEIVDKVMQQILKIK